MTKEIKVLLKGIIKYDITIGLIFATVIYFILGMKIASIFLLGILISLLNFVFSGIILEKGLINENKIIRVLFPFSFLIRIIIVVAIAVPFMYDAKELLAYIFGFVVHFPILIFSWIRRQKGSD